jgi:hypothetical protein
MIKWCECYRQAFFSCRHHEAGPNIEVAELCIEEPKHLDEVRDHLQSRDRRLQGDCVEVFTEVAKIRPELTAMYVDDLLTMLDTRNNRAFWEDLAGLSLIVPLTADKIYPYREKLFHLARTGSVLVVDGAVSTLVRVAAQNDSYSVEIFPRLLEILEDCSPRDLPRMAGYIAPSVRENPSFKERMMAVLGRRISEVEKKSAKDRLKRLIRSME